MPEPGLRGDSDWFRLFGRYLRENDLAWGYWALNGTQSSG